MWGRRNAVCPLATEGSIGGDAAEIEPAFVLVGGEDGRKIFPDGRCFPCAFKSEKSRQNRLRPCRALAVDRLYGRAGAMETAYGRHLLLCISHKPRLNLLLGFEQGVDGFRRHNDLILVLDNQGRVLAVEEHYVNLIAELAFAVHDCRFTHGIALRQVFSEKRGPNRFAPVAFGNRMPKCLAGCFQVLLYAFVQGLHESRQRPLDFKAHRTMSSQDDAAASLAALAAALTFAFSRAVRSSEIMLLVFAGSAILAG